MLALDDMDVYKLGHEITLTIYKETGKFPKSELFGLTAQMRRAAVSINSNLSEGVARKTNGEYKHFIGIARGSASELKYQIIVSKDLGFMTEDVANKLIGNTDRVKMMLSKLMQSLNESRIPNPESRK
ncbi:MAG: four helix bundle protein [Rickettsiales bacterium]|jgi:four helix bundle protein|nr:four helix bundle protein [Rickettsiales bacterium]